MAQNDAKTHSDAIISVVVPVFRNTFLKECIESVLSQTFRRFELILVDDGSLDDSGQICDNYALHDSRIKVIHKNNEGAGISRWRGVQAAESEWITFLDSDDTLTSDALQHLFALHDDTDIVVGFLTPPTHIKDYTLEECKRNAITGHDYPSSPCAKLYRRTLFNAKVFLMPRALTVGEDMIMNVRLAMRLKRPIRFCYAKVYNYRRNTVSVSHSHKGGLDYEQLFYTSLDDSFTQEERDEYSHEIIKMKLNGLVGIAFTNAQAITARRHPYLTNLISQIRQYGYQLSAKEWLLLHLHPAIILKAFAFLILAKTSLTYRLRLPY